MGCAPSIHVSEDRPVYQGGKEAGDAPGPAAAPPSSGEPRLPQGPKTAVQPGTRGTPSLVESEPRDGSSKKVKGAAEGGGAGPGELFGSRATCPPGLGWAPPGVPLASAGGPPATHRVNLEEDDADPEDSGSRFLGGSCCWQSRSVCGEQGRP